jgi:hypothetical protein
VTTPCYTAGGCNGNILLGWSNGVREAGCRCEGISRSLVAALAMHCKCINLLKNGSIAGRWG